MIQWVSETYLSTFFIHGGLKEGGAPFPARLDDVGGEPGAPWKLLEVCDDAPMGSRECERENLRLLHEITRDFAGSGSEVGNREIWRQTMSPQVC